MHPLFKLWIMVLLLSVLLGVVFYMADHYAHIIGDFWVLFSICMTCYCLYYLTDWIRKRKNKKLSV